PILEQNAAVRARNRSHLYLAIAVLAIAASVAWTFVGPDLMASTDGSGETAVQPVEALEEPRLLVVSEPPGATIFVDGVLRAEQTPAEIPLDNEVTSRVRLEAAGFAPQVLTVSPSQSRVRYVSAALAPLARESRGAGTIRVLAEPDDALVFVDDILRGSASPLTVGELTIGSPHELRVQREGYDIRRYQFTLNSTSPEVFDIQLPEAMASGTLSVVTEPAGAEVTINGQSVGITPLEEMPVSSNVDLDVSLTLAGYQVYHTTMRLEEGGRESLTQQLERRVRASSNSASSGTTDDGQEAAQESTYELLP
ncbi:MAG: PEGA domain-containing protein, partial [Myxococcales bacterium]|nr:PEGA domain-containing protein [Myxococcales bacterium]